MTIWLMSPKQSNYLPSALLVAGLVIAVGAGFTVMRSSAGARPPHPAPAVDEQAGAQTSEVAVLAAGCFWGVQGVFQHVNGVTNAVSGYAGGEAKTAHYEIGGNGRGGAAR